MPGRKPGKVTFAGLALAAWALLLPLSLAQAQQPDPAKLALCTACHGPQGNSQIPLTPSLAGQPRVFLENQLVLIREGLRSIPEMKGLIDGVDDASIGALSVYFSAQAPAKAEGTVDATSYVRGQAIAGRMLCGSCHLPSYAGQQQVPRLAGQREPFLLHSMKQFRDNPGQGRDTIMAASLHGLKDGELSDLAHFLTHFK